MRACVFCFKVFPLLFPSLVLCLVLVRVAGSVAARSLLNINGSCSSSISSCSSNGGSRRIIAVVIGVAVVVVYMRWFGAPSCF